MFDINTPKHNTEVSSAELYYKKAQNFDSKQELENAYLWYRKAAELGHPEAQYQLHICYSSACGISLNPTQALFWYREAVKSGSIQAKKEYMLSWCDTCRGIVVWIRKIILFIINAILGIYVGAKAGASLGCLLEVNILTTILSTIGCIILGGITSLVLMCIASQIVTWLNDVAYKKKLIWWAGLGVTDGCILGAIFLSYQLGNTSGSKLVFLIIGGIIGGIAGGIAEYLMKTIGELKWSHYRDRFCINK